MRALAIFVAGGTLILSVLAWLWLSGFGQPIGLRPSQASAQTLDIALPLLGVVAASAVWGLILLLRPRAEPTLAEGKVGDSETGAPPLQTGAGAGQAVQGSGVDRGRRQGLDRVAMILGIAVTLAGVLLVIAVVRSEIGAVPAALVLICGTLTLFAGTHALEGLARGESIEINTHWGGLGGSMGGWRLSSITTLLALALLFLGATLLASKVEGGNGDVADVKRPAGRAQQPAGGRATGNGGTSGAIDPAISDNMSGNAL